MGARLKYAKVIDRQLFYERGGKLHPGLESEVVVADEPGNAAAFLILRGWGDDRGSFTESWGVETPGGTVLYESVPREIHLATAEHVEKLEDEVSDLFIEYAADDYDVVFRLDGREVGRAKFGIRVDAAAEEELSG
jgi:hypothetical protein